MQPLEIRSGSFYRDGKKILPTGPVYFGRTPGTCGGDWFAPEYWAANEANLARDFALMKQVGLTWAIPFINLTPFFKGGKPAEAQWKNVARMIEIARSQDIYLIPFPNLDGDDASDPVRQVLGRDNPDPKGMTLNQHAFSDYLFEAQVTAFGEFARRFGSDPAVPLIMGRSGGRLWTAYAGFRPGEPEVAELLPVKPFWQAWLRARYQDDFTSFVRHNPCLPEQPRGWDEIALPTEVEGQFTRADSRTFDFLAFQAETMARTNDRFYGEIKRIAPGVKTMSVHEGCEWSCGPQENYIPGLLHVDAVWIEMYGFNMAYGSQVAPNWQRQGFVEPTTGKDQIDSLAVCSEAWERCRYFKAAAPEVALIPCHGSVMTAFLRWAREEKDQRILFERLQRVYMEAGADGIGWWCWSDDDSSARPEPEFFHREGEQMGVIDLQHQYRPVARRMRTYLSAKIRESRVSDEVLLLVPSGHRLGLEQIDANMTNACLTSACARLGIQPDVKHTWFKGRGPISLSELTPYSVVIVSADEYQRDFPEMPATLLAYVQQGGRLLLSFGEDGRMRDQRGAEMDQTAWQTLVGAPEIEATYHQHWNPWTVSLRWQLRDDCLPYWNQRRGRYMAGRREKEMTFKWVQLPANAQLLAEAVAPSPYKGTDPAELQKYFTQTQKISPWSPLFYKQTIGAGEVYVFTYSFNVFRSWLDEMDYQRDDWDWVLQAVFDAAQVATDPTAALSVLAQEFLNFRPTR